VGAVHRAQRHEDGQQPFAGNKAGGLTTILEKSLGAIAKSGTTNLVDVVEFAGRVGARGLVYMDTPGYDPVSATGQVAGGANLICFTTGRGSAYGCAPAPSLKLSTNTALWLAGRRHRHRLRRHRRRHRQRRCRRRTHLPG
jgi:altronate hydrolase